MLTSLLHFNIIFLNHFRLNFMNFSIFVNCMPSFLFLFICMFRIFILIPISLSEIKCVESLSWFSDGANLALLLQQLAHPALLLADVRHWLQLLLPSLRDNDGVFLDLLTLDRVSLAVGMIYNRLDIARVQGVPHIVHICSAAASAFGISIRKEVGHARQRDNFLVEILNADLVEAWRVAEPHLLHLEESFLAGQHLLQVIFCDHDEWRQVVLSDRITKWMKHLELMSANSYGLITYRFCSRNWYQSLLLDSFPWISVSSISCVRRCPMVDLISARLDICAILIYY